MQNLRVMAAPAYLIALVLILVPLLDTSISLLPPRPGELSWRFGAAGLLSQQQLLPMIGILIAATMALLLQHRRVLRGLSVICLVLVLVVIPAVVLFALDAVQLRAQVVAEARLTFDLAAAMAVAKFVISAVVLAVIGRAAWKASAKPVTRRSPSPDTLVAARPASQPGR